MSTTQSVNLTNEYMELTMNRPQKPEPQRVPNDNKNKGPVLNFGNLVDSVGRFFGNNPPSLYLFRGQTRMHFTAAGNKSVRRRAQI